MALVAVAAACSRSGYQFVRNAPTGTYLKVPSDWTVFGPSDLTEALQKEGVSEKDFHKRTPFVTTFEAKSSGTLRPFDPTSKHPMGMVRVTQLTAEERDSTSFATLREELFEGFNAGLESGEIEVVKAEDVKRDNVRGQHLVYRIKDPNTGDRVVIDQTTLVDQATSRSYLLAVGCTATCFERNRSAIDEVVSSLTIKEK